MNGSLLIAYKVTFVNLHSEGLTNFVGSVAFLGFGFFRGFFFLVGLVLKGKCCFLIVTVQFQE